MKIIFFKLICFILCLSTLQAISQSGIVFPHGIKVPEVQDLDQVVSPVEGMMVYSEQQKGIYLRKADSWEILSEAILSSDAHIFLEIDGVTPDLYDEPVNSGYHTDESKILEVDFTLVRKIGASNTLGALSSSFKFKKKLGRSSLEISKAVMQSKSFPEIVFTFYVRDPSTLVDIPYYRYTLTNVKFVSNQLIGPHPELNTLIQNSPSRKAKSLIEEVQVIFEEVEIRDLVNNYSFSYDFNY